MFQRCKIRLLNAGHLLVETCHSLYIQRKLWVNQNTSFNTVNLQMAASCVLTILRGFFDYFLLYVNLQWWKNKQTNQSSCGEENSASRVRHEFTMCDVAHKSPAFGEKKEWPLVRLFPQTTALLLLSEWRVCRKFQSIWYSIDWNQLLTELNYHPSQSINVLQPVDL